MNCTLYTYGIFQMIITERNIPVATLFKSIVTGIILYGESCMERYFRRNTYSLFYSGESNSGFLFIFTSISFSSTIVFRCSPRIRPVPSCKGTPGLEGKTRSSLLFLKKSPHLRCCRSKKLRKFIPFSLFIFFVSNLYYKLSHNYFGVIGTLQRPVCLS